MSYHVHAVTREAVSVLFNSTTRGIVLVMIPWDSLRSRARHHPDRRLRTIYTCLFREAWRMAVKSTAGTYSRVSVEWNPKEVKI